MKPIPLTQGKVAWVDDDDYAELSQFNWHYIKAGYALRTGLLSRGEKHLPVYLHRQIMQPPDGFEVDHINGDKLLNIRQNLRVVTRRQNTMNKGLSSVNTSGHKGIHWCEQRRRWVARIGLNNRTINLGRFRSLDDAIAAKTAAIKKYHGEFGRQDWSDSAVA